MRRIHLYIAILLLVPVVSVGVLFFIPGPSGKPLMSKALLEKSLGGDWAMVRDAKQIRKKASETANTIREKTRAKLKSKGTERFDAPVDAPSETLFKWRDKEGNWHFSNQLPQDDVTFEIVGR